MDNLYKKVEETIRKYEMLKKRDRVLVGVSGGADSIFLLYALFRLKDKLGIEPIVANLDHGMRGRASEVDSKFVRKQTKAIGLKFIHKKLKICKKTFSGKLSGEEALRAARYSFFRKAAARVNARILATGHTLDDQAETVMMRIIKGTTIKGLVGILPKRKDNGLTIIRPLIELEKRDIIVFLDKNRIGYRTDLTNFQEDYFRNKTRRKILPYLSRYNPRIKRSLFLMAESLMDDHEFIEAAKKEKRNLITKKKKDISIKLKNLVMQPRTIQREILRDALSESGGSIKNLTYRHWRDMDNFLKYKRKGKSLDLPGGIMIKRGEKELFFIKRR